MMPGAMPGGGPVRFRRSAPAGSPEVVLPDTTPTVTESVTPTPTPTATEPVTPTPTPTPTVTEPVTPTPATLTGLLVVTAREPGAEVWVDGVRFAGPPWQIELAPGAHAMGVRAPGYVSRQATVRIVSGLTTRADVSLVAEVSELVTQSPVVQNPARPVETGLATQSLSPGIAPLPSPTSMISTKTMLAIGVGLIAVGLLAWKLGLSTEDEPTDQRSVTSRKKR